VVYEQDYILRLIQRVGVFLRAIASALREHRPEDALELSEEALHHITGLSSDAATTTSISNLLLILSAGGRVDVKRAILLAEVFAERAEAFQQQGDRRAVERELAKARALAEAAAAAAPDSDDGDRARMLLAHMNGDNAAGDGEVVDPGTSTEDVAEG
jgi:hypothetical protein